MPYHVPRSRILIADLKIVVAAIGSLHLHTSRSTSRSSTNTLSHPSTCTASAYYHLLPYLPYLSCSSPSLGRRPFLLCRPTSKTSIIPNPLPPSYTLNRNPLQLSSSSSSPSPHLTSPRQPENDLLHTNNPSPPGAKNQDSDHPHLSPTNSHQTGLHSRNDT